MEFNSDIFFKTVIPFFTLLFGAWLNRFIEKRVKLIAYFIHASTTEIKHPQNPPITINSHSIVVLNAGKLPANNVRIVHNILPNFSIHPSTNYVTSDLPDKTKEIIIAKLLPGEQVTISYLYFPPLFYNQIHNRIKSDEVLAKEINVIPSPQYPKWLINLLKFLIFVGVASLLYSIWALVSFVFYRT